MKKTAKTIKGLALAAGCALTLASPLQAETWRFNNFLPESRPETPELARFAEEVTSLTGGDLQVDIYSGGSLGLENTDVLRFLPRGAVEMSLIWSNYLGRDAPAMSSVILQGAMGSVEAYHAALPEIRAIYTEELEKWGITPVGFAYLPMFSVSVFCNGKPVRTMEDLRKAKLRVWARDQIETFTRLGVAAQIIPQEDMYVAMRTGVVDCALYPPQYAHTVSLQEVSETASHLFRMASSPYIIGVATDRWDAMDEASRQAVLTAGENLWQRTTDRSSDSSLEDQVVESLSAQGVKFLDAFSPEDQAVFTAAVSQTWAKLTEEAGGDAPGYRARVLAAMGRE